MSTWISTLLSDCSSIEYAYEKAISDYVQTDRNGKWIDRQFRVVSMEMKSCTVTDGIRIMQEDAKEEQDKAIAYETEWLENFRSHLGANCNNGYPSQVLTEIFQKNIERTEQRIDSLRKNDPYKDVFYEDTESDMVLAIYVTCKYSIVFPGKNNTCQERTETFILSPDGETVLGKEKKGMKK